MSFSKNPERHKLSTSRLLSPKQLLQNVHLELFGFHLFENSNRFPYIKPLGGVLSHHGHENPPFPNRAAAAEKEDTPWNWHFLPQKIVAWETILSWERVGNWYLLNRDPTSKGFSSQWFDPYRDHPSLQNLATSNPSFWNVGPQGTLDHKTLLNRTSQCCCFIVSQQNCMFMCSFRLNVYSSKSKSSPKMMWTKNNYPPLIIAPENGWLEYDRFLSRMAYVQGLSRLHGEGTSAVQAGGERQGVRADASP